MKNTAEVTNRMRTIVIICIALFSSYSTLLVAQDAGSNNTGNNNSNNYSNASYNTNAFTKGSNILNLGVGIGGDYTYYGNGYASTPNFVLSYDNGTFGGVGPGTISLGGLLSYKGMSYSYTPNGSGYYYDQNWSYYIIGLRSAYHWNFTSSSKFDPYIGIMLGYYDIGYTERSNDPDYKNPNSPYYYYYTDNYNSYMALSLYIGARYFISDKVGVWLELGYGYSDAAFGVSFKL